MIYIKSLYKVQKVLQICKYTNLKRIDRSMNLKKVYIIFTFK